MSVKIFPRILLLFAAAGVSIAPRALAAAETETVPAKDAPFARPWTDDASRAIPKRNNPTFFALHQSFLARAREGPVDLLFLGDSITHHWRNYPHLWTHFYGSFNAANFGIGGDQTQHIIWRIENGELDHVHPKVVVLMIGTNNTSTYTAEQILHADEKIVRLIREKLPASRVLLLGIFPRGPRKGSHGTFDDAVKRMQTIHTVNAGLARLDDGDHIRYLDIGARFLGDDDQVARNIMPDHLHPNGAGYELWGEAMQPLLLEMIRASAGSPAAPH